MYAALTPFLPTLRLLGAFIVVAVLLWQFRSCATSTSPGPPHIVSVDTITRTPDTVRVISPPDTVTITEVRTQTIWRNGGPVATIDSSSGRHDTVLVCEEFRAEFDTTVQGVRLQGAIANPPLRLADLSMTLPPDTATTITQGFEIRTVIERARPWYETAAMIGGGFTAGYLARMGVEDLSSAPGSGSGGGRYDRPVYYGRAAILEVRF